MRQTSSCSEPTLESGLTLIEIMVALMLAAVMIAVALPAFKAATDADLKAQAIRISGASRTCFGEAAVKNATLRVAYDLDAGMYWVEAYPGTFQLVKEERDLDEVRDQEKEAEEDAKREKELKERYARDTDDEAAAPVPKFVPVKIAFEEPQRLPRGVKFAGVRTPQFKQPVKDGRAYTHFFPNGWAERTLVYLEDSGGSKMTLETDPLTGRVILHDGELDYREVEEARDKENK